MAEALLKLHYVAVVKDAPPVWNVLFVCTYLLYHIAALSNSSDTTPGRPTLPFACAHRDRVKTRRGRTPARGAS